MVRRFFEAKNGDTLEFWGSGNTLRQQLYVDDLAHTIPMLLDKHHSDIPIIVAPSENLSISDMIDILRTYVNKDVNIKFNSHLDGQYRKDGSNAKLVDMIGDFNFTPFEEGANWMPNAYCCLILNLEIHGLDTLRKQFPTDQLLDMMSNCPYDTIITTH